jgi:hypothetical protein
MIAGETVQQRSVEGKGGGKEKPRDFLIRTARILLLRSEFHAFIFEQPCVSNNQFD